MSDSGNKMPRRNFVKKAAYASAVVSAIPSFLSSCTNPKEAKKEEEEELLPIDNKKREFPKGKLNVVVIGLGMGYGNFRNCSDENLVAMCDVDTHILRKRLTQFHKKDFPDKPIPYAYQNFKKMFEEIGDQIDAVIIATPDHSHAYVTLYAMKHGKHVYTQKPLTHNVYESRILTEAAKKYPVATQMGNQGASAGTTDWACEAIWDGAIGEIKEVHAWTNRPIWPQAMNRPKDTPPVPAGLDWDIWLGPAPNRPYSPLYHPWNWRGWWAFGTGALGDMACHILDVAVRALKLEYPYAVQASSSRWTIESPAESQIITYYFPERPPLKKVKLPKVKLMWYDGGLKPPRPQDLKDDEPFGDGGGGVLFVGTKGKLSTGTYAQHPVLIPSDKYKGYKPPRTRRRVPGGAGGHEKDWIRACKESPDKRVETKSSFKFAGPFNEVVVMGTIAPRLQALNRILQWDGPNMKFTNIKPEEFIKVPKAVIYDKSKSIPRYVTEWVKVDAFEYAKHMVKRKPRKGWELEL